MSSHDSLLRRIARASRPRRTGELDARSIHELHESIVRNLQRIVSSRQGGSKSCPDYGLPELDHTSEGFAAQVAEFATRLAHMLETYEPRLDQVRVTHRRIPKGEVDPDPLHLTLDIKGRISGAGPRYKARFVARFSPDGRVHVGAA